MSQGSAGIAAFSIALVSLLIYPSAGIRCHASSSGLLRDADASVIDCESRDYTCHEKYYYLRDAESIVYLSGCGRYFMSLEMQLNIGRNIVEEKLKECYTDGCNTELRTEMESTHRVCHSAYRAPSIGEYAIACPTNVTTCYFDAMAGAKQQAYFAGCGACPSYTLYCFTCKSNYCNSTLAKKQVVVVNSDEVVDDVVDDYWPSYDYDDAAVVTCHPLAASVPPILTLALMKLASLGPLI